MLLSIRGLLVGFILISATASVAADNSFSAFQATYDLFRDDKQVGESFFLTEKTDDRIDMQMITKPGGLYALITSQRPVTESTLIHTKGDFHLSEVRISVNRNLDPAEHAVFDWQKSLLTVNRNREQRQLPLSEEVYDYLSIHWLAAQMSLADADRYQLKFYRKGKLRDSTLTRTGTEILEIGGRKINTTTFEHTFKISSRQLKYHYDQKNPWLPVRIERTRKGKKKTVLLLKSVVTND
ncbi:MAG: DUF3108 domain-containing protein [Gammaproteobacteria bacterium]|nr:DUF3108 domain-containing protein [Gammaproteobacteria bacterium]